MLFVYQVEKLWFIQGILKIAKNDDQLATVISHEISHALARHGAERMGTSMVQQGLQVLGNVALGGNSTTISKIYLTKLMVLELKLVLCFHMEECKKVKPMKSEFI